MSAKRKANSAEYYRLRNAFMKENPYCKRCGRKATDCHHSRLRGKYYLDPTTYIALCRWCHKFVHDNPAKAEEEGLLHPDRFK